MARSAALALVLLAFMGGEAQATDFSVVVIPGLGLETLHEWQDEGAVGLLVPGAGPETSEAMALAALRRGRVENSLRGGFPAGEPLVEPVRSVAPGEARIVVGIPSGGRQPNDRRYPIVVMGGGFEGLLVSESTRIAGLVSIADVAPTALGREDGLAWQAEEAAAERLRALDERIDGHNEVRLPATLLACALVAVLAFAFPRAAVLALAAALGANLALGAAGVTSLWLVLLVTGLAVVAAAPLLALLARPPLALGLVLAGVVAAYLVALGLDGSAVALSPFGPTQNARFYGISNLLGTMLLVPAFAAAAALGARLGPLAFAGIAVLAVVTVAGNRFGADGGGALVLAAGFGVLALLLVQARRKVRVLLVLGTVAALALVVAVDLAAGPSTHVSRAVGEGAGSLAGDLGRRLDLSLDRALERWYVAVLIAAGTILLAVLAVRLARADVAPGRKALPLAVATAVAVSLLVNDSPNDVVLVGLVSYLAAAAVMLRGRCAASWSSLPLRSSSPAAGAARSSPPSRRP